MNRTWLEILRDPNFAAHAVGEPPVWLFDASGTRLLFANPAGAALFGFATCSAAAGASFVNTEVAAHISRSATTLAVNGQPRLERLRGLGAPFGRPLTCACSKVASPFGLAVLVAAVDVCAPVFTPAERARRLIEGSGLAAAVYDADGHLLYAEPDAASEGDRIVSLSDVDGDALRIGDGADAVTLVLSGRPKVDIAAAPRSNDETATAAVDLSPIADAMAAMSRAPNHDGATGSDPVARQHHPDQPHPPHSLRFDWDTDAENRFTIRSTDFVNRAGPRTANLLGRFWGEISAKLALDPDGLVAHAMISREPWNGIAVNWPTADGARMRVELSGVPAFDADGIFCGYHGRGVCPDELSDATDEAAAASSRSPAAESQDDATIWAKATPSEDEIAAQPENVVPFRTGGPDPRQNLKPADANAPEAASQDPASRLTMRLKGADELARGQVEKSATRHARPDLVGPAAPPAILAQTVPELPPFADTPAQQVQADIQDLLAARQRAEQASSAKSDFLAKVSHELRIPLNAIIGFSEVMLEERFGPIGNERYRDYLKDINTCGAHIVSLLTDLLDMSKIEAGKFELNLEPVNLNELTQQSVAIMQAQASRERIIIRTALLMNVPDIVADPRSVRQIILNLLSNSIKFTGAGGQVIVSTTANDHGEVTLRVRDTGVGMSETDIETALQPFRQLATSPASKTNGTGLGLPLTRALAEANHARFSIKSAVHAGTLVEIVFAAPRPRPQ